MPYLFHSEVWRVSQHFDHGSFRVRLHEVGHERRENWPLRPETIKQQTKPFTAKQTNKETKKRQAKTKGVRIKFRKTSQRRCWQIKIADIRSFTWTPKQKKKKDEKEQNTTKYTKEKKTYARLQAQLGNKAPCFKSNSCFSLKCLTGTALFFTLFKVKVFIISM